MQRYCIGDPSSTKNVHILVSCKKYNRKRLGLEHVIVIWHQFERGMSETCLRESCWPRNLAYRSAAADLMALNSRPYRLFLTPRQHLFCFLWFMDQTVPPLLLTSLWFSAPSVFRFMDREACIWHWPWWTSEKEWEGDRTANRSLCHDAARDRHEGRGERKRRSKSKRTACCNRKWLSHISLR